MSFDLFPNEQSAALLNASRHPSAVPEPGVFDNFASGAGRYTMRSLAEAGRAVSMAGAVVPIVADRIVGNDNLSGESLTDRYFDTHNEVFNTAVEHWTPRPGEVGAAGQVAGQLAGGILQAVISPALLVGTAQLSAAEDLVREGVTPGTANTVGAIQGAGMAVGVRMPFLGTTLASRVLSGAGGNLAQGVATAGASSAVLKGEGYDTQAERFNPWDLRARMLDVMLGASFGGLAHIGARGATNRDISPQEDYKIFLQERGLTEQRVQEMMADQPVAPFPADAAKIKRGPSKISGEGMVASEDIMPGDLIAPGSIDGHKTPAGRYLNHSNNPNAEVRAKDNGDLDVFALQPIPIGDEVTINYRQVGEVNGLEPKLTPTDEAALLVANQARHIEDATPNGRPATDVDATLHADAMRQAVGQVLRGEPVTVDATIRDMQLVPDGAQHLQRVEVGEELHRLTAEEAPLSAPIMPPIEQQTPLGDTINPAQHVPASLKARQIAVDQPDLMVPTKRIDADGRPVTIRAADALAIADAEVAHAQVTAADVFKTAAHCLLGVL